MELVGWKNKMGEKKIENKTFSEFQLFKVFRYKNISFYIYHFGVFISSFSLCGVYIGPATAKLNIMDVTNKISTIA